MTAGCAKQKVFPLCRLRSQRGTVLLVALCFVAVLAISLASYVAICSRAMQLSNRSHQAALSQQLAEMGLEEALRAFNKNDWSNWAANPANVTSGNWTLDSTYSRATRTITFDAGKLGQGATGTVKIRVDNYNVQRLGSAWSATKTYRVHDTVGYNGLWYSCVKDHSNQAPSVENWTYWVPSHIPWRWSTSKTYKAEEMVNYGGTWYRCILAHGNHAPPNGTYWTAVPSVYFSPSIDYTNEAILNWYGTWYRYSTSIGWDVSPLVTWRYRTGYTYTYDDLVCYNSVWYRFINATPTANITPGSNASYWEDALSGTVHAWSNASINHNLGDVVYYGGTGQWYRCILAHTSSTSLTPTNTTYWANTPALSLQWKTGPYYAANDVVSYNGTWYLCIQAHTASSSILPTNTSYWVGANTANTSYIWNATTSYGAGAYRCHGGVWYKSISANMGRSPNNSTYWTAAWTQSSGVTSGAPVIYAEGSVTLAGSGTTRTQLRTVIGPAPLFPNAIGSNTTLTISGGTGTIDSYDSSLGAYGGTNVGYSAVLAAGTTSAGGTSALMTIGNGITVQGYAAAPSSTSSPYAPRTSFGTGAVVKGAASPASPNVDLARVTRSPFVPLFTTLPTPSLSSAFSAGTFPRGRSLPTNFSGTDNTLNLGMPGAVTPSRYYYNATMNVGTGYDLATVNINGPVILYINGNLNLQSGGTLKIATTGSAEIHVDGRVLSQTGAVGFINESQDPKNLFLISDLASTTAQRLFAPTPATNAFYGLIYMPQSTATYGLEIRTGVVIYGALSANEVTFNNEANLHYDTSLRYATFTGVEQPYAITEWRELTDASELATMP